MKVVAADGVTKALHNDAHKHALGQHSYVAQLDALRAIAVLAVMLFHLNPSWLPGGFVGVDIFFVLSGYVVSASLTGDSAKSLRDFTIRFYSKRILRIVPALLLCLVATAVLTTLFVPSSWLSNGSRETIWLAFFGVSNFSLMNSGDPYFSPRSEFNTATHTWSLGVEEQFYLVFPLIWFFWVRAKGSLTKGGNITTRWPGLLLIGLLLASSIFSAVVSQASPIVAYYAMPSRFWELCAGALLLASHRQGSFIAGRMWSHDLQLALAVLLLGIAVVFSDKTLFPMPWALISVTGALTFIDAVMAPKSETSAIRRLLGMWLLPAIGRVSYSLYLWHWPIYVLMRWTVGLDGATERVFAAAATFITAIASYQLLERPIRRNGALLRCAPWRVVAGGLVCVLLMALLADAVVARQYRFSLSQTKNFEVWYPNIWKGTSSDGCRVKVHKSQIVDGYLDISVREGCIAPEASRTLFVVGDSHATSLVTMLTRTAVEQNVRFALYNKPGCSFLSMMEPTRTECLPFTNAAANEIIAKANPGDVVLLSSLRLPRLGNQWGLFSEADVMARRNSDEARLERTAAQAEAAAFIARAERVGLRVVFSAPTPIFRAPAFRCSDWFNKRNPVCEPGLEMPRTFLQDYRQPVLDAYRELGTKYPSLRIWDAFPVLCPDQTCSVWRDGMPIFMDGDHLSGYGNLLVYDSFVSALDPLD